ncbi:MAG: C25 family cysteine peptidase [bacterium]|nr:C25 family cysteine peptidase [bacterium]
MGDRKLRSTYCWIVLAVVLLPARLFALTKGNLVIQEVVFRPPTITSSSFSPEFHHIDIPDTVSYGQVGEPVLPMKGVKLLIPPDKKVAGVEIITGEKVILDGIYNIEPGQRVYPISQIEQRKTFDQPKQEIYKVDTIFPSQRGLGEPTQRKMGYSIAIIKLYPVEYRPQSGIISYYKTMKVVVTLADSDTKAKSMGVTSSLADIRNKTTGWSEDREVVERLVDNKEDLPLYNNYSSPSGSVLNQSQMLGNLPVFPYTYVIITRADFVNAFQDLAIFRYQQGLLATIVTTDWIYANYDGTRPDGGTDNQTKIRNFIKDAYATWGTKYVLLGGDSDSANVGGESEYPIVPMRGLVFIASDPGYTNMCIPADLYYGCLDGSFDGNGNGLYGEPNDGENGQDVDLMAEVYIGRAPVDSVEEINNFVRKTLAYEAADKTYTEDNYTVGECLGGGGLSQYSTGMLEQIRLGSSDNGYTTKGFLTDPDRSLPCLTLYDSPDTTWTTSQIISVLNKGVHTVNHFGHASPWGVMKLGINEVEALTNTKYFIMYTNGCDTAAFDNEGGASDSIGEHFVTSAQGAVAFLGNSRAGWFTCYSTDSASHFYHRQFWNAFFDQGIKKVGRMTADSKEDIIPYINNGMNRWCGYEVNLLGDPALNVNVMPIPMVVYPSQISYTEGAGGDGDGLFDPGESSFCQVTLQALNQDAYNVSISLWSDDPYLTVSPIPVNFGTILKSQSMTGTKMKITISPDAPEFAIIPLKLSINASGYHVEKDISIQIHGQREKQLTFSSSDQIKPDIAGKYIAWQDHSADNDDIFLYDIPAKTAKIVSPISGSQCNPAISSAYLIWQDIQGDFCHLAGYDLVTGFEDCVPMYVHKMPQQVDISGSQVVYADCLNDRWEVSLSDLLTAQYRPLTNDYATQLNPKIDGNYAVWQDDRNGNWDIYMQDLITRQETRITNDGADQIEPAISGNYIVWMDNRVGDWHIFLYDLATQQTIQLNTYGSQSHPDISGKRVVWQDYRNGNYDIYMYDIDIHIGVAPVATNVASQCYPKISDDYITWQDNRNGNWDVYSYCLGDMTPPTAPVVVDAGLFTSSLSSLSATWTSSDQESGLVEYQYRVLVDCYDGTVVRDWTSVGAITSTVITDLSLVHGKTYYVAVKAKNEAGRWSRIGYSDGIMIDATAPSMPEVTDSGAYTTSTNTLAASFTSADQESGLAEYLYCIRLGSPRGTILKNWTSTGLMPEVTAAGLNLTSGKTYFIGVKAMNGVNVWSAEGYSDGIKVDTTPATLPKVTDSGSFTTSTNQLTASFSSSDSQSGIVEYQYIITVDTPTGVIVKDWTSTGITTSVTVSGLTLQNGRNYYFSVKARNGAGLWSATGYSNGIIVDATAPSTPVVVDDGSVTVSTTTLHASWSAVDLESGITQYQYRITQNKTNGTVIRGWTATGTVAEVTAKDLNLIAGKKYYFSVKAKNCSGLWSAVGYSDGITISP